ncbi:Dabb family protein [Sphingobacterium humi]|uniref:Dabb family protein n=1 Tax=Sphingobacterium humi TaxID=1796905 RepID=A0A6N8KVL2_9SPHI|nr:Dabb family protein [Sphingobacterium humi]MVZ60739.1 Dabb family protein [Sphingobacterium humi]
MKRKHFIASMVVGGASGSLLGACDNPKNIKTASPTAFSSGTIVHSVYFWLKEGITAEEEQEFLQFFEILKKVPGIKDLQVGKPSPTTPRPVVDNSFSYFLMVTFNSMDDINTYEKHPEHLAASEAFSKYWTKVEVKDATLI